MLSALFLLVFAIAVIVPWTTADAARQNTQVESRAVADAYWGRRRAAVRHGGADPHRVAGVRDLCRGGRVAADGPG
ncbi:hypothetical protein ACFSTC_30725 [Nonomuraea ferruginea]